MTSVSDASDRRSGPGSVSDAVAAALEPTATLRGDRLIKSQLGNQVTMVRSSIPVPANLAELDMPASGRRKLWDIPPLFHCSLLGLCLGLQEMRQLAAKLGIKTNSARDDYQVHHQLVHVARQNSRAGKRLHRHLENKYGDCVQVVRKSRCMDELANLWAMLHESEEYDLGALYWALLTNPYVPDSLMESALNDVHMFSHSAAASIRKSNITITNLQTELSACQSVLKREKRARNELAEQAQALQSRLDEQSEGACQVIRLRDKIDALERRLVELDGASRLVDEVAGLRVLLAAARQDARLWKTQSTALQGEIERHRDEVETLRKQADAVRGEDSAACESAHLPDLDGAVVAYVGGRNQVVPKLRQITEQLNGQFVHHDGGVEDRIGRMDDCIAGWDILVVPLDCVSHDAARRIKRSVRLQNKPLLWLRTCSVSSYCRALAQLQLPQ